jgi:hypothetical protein
VRKILPTLCFVSSLCVPVLAQNPSPLSLKAYSTIDGPKITPVNSGYRIENVAPGSFGVLWDLSQTDAAKMARLSFEWKPSNDTKVNFFFKVSGKYYAVILSGSENVRAGTRILGRATTTNLPDGFQRVEIPLRAWLSALNPNFSTLPVEELLLGNWSNEGYLLAGIGGNGAGANYLLRNVKIRDISETKSAPEIQKPTLKNNEIVWPIVDFAGIDTSTFKFRAGENVFDLNSPYLNIDSEISGDNLIQTIRFNAGAAGMSLKDGQALPLVLEGLKGATGKMATSAPDGTVSNSVTFATSQYKEKPPLPRLTIENHNFQNEGDFETGDGGFIPRTSVIERLPAPNRTGYALRLTNPKTAGRFETLLAPALDVAQFPAISFDYRCDNRVRLNFLFRWDSVDYSIKFLDRDTYPKTSKIVSLDPIPNPKADESWTSASYDLLEVLKKIRPDAKTFNITNLILSDDHWMGNARGVTFWLDNFYFVPKATSSFKADVLLRDLSGINGVSYAFDQNPTTPVDENVEKSTGAVARIEVPQSARTTGIWYLHVRAKNNAGIWSDTSHFPVYISP